MIMPGVLIFSSPVGRETHEYNECKKEGTDIHSKEAYSQAITCLQTLYTTCRIFTDTGNVKNLVNSLFLSQSRVKAEDGSCYFQLTTQLLFSDQRTMFII